MDDLPPSARRVLEVVEREEEISRAELLDRVVYSESTVNTAVSQLVREGRIERDRAASDLRNVVYRLK